MSTLFTPPDSPPSSVTHSDGPAKRLKEQLRNTRTEDTANHRFYIPREIQYDLINRDIVSEIAAQIDRPRVQQSTIEEICTRGRALFAILVLIKKQADIQPFLDEGILDASLPLQRVNGTKHFSLQTKHGRRVKSVVGWNSGCREKFDRIQWWFLAPIFEDLEHYELDENVVLPTVPFEDKNSSLDSGGYSEVYPVRIHHTHHRWSAIADPESTGPVVAIKRLIQSEEEEFKREQEILIQLTPKGHPHLIKLLSTFQQGGKWHLMFPFADSNLRAYWEVHSMPVFDQDTIQWVLKQMVGIASALARIHSFVGTFHRKIPRKVEVADGTIIQVQDQEKLYGRHGDIKPENFLWFKDTPGVDDPMGVIQLADFGLGRFHGRDSRSRTHASTVPYSPTYEPPECKIGRSVSRVYDMWSLGCVYLEFVTWLVLGFKEIEGFSDYRGEWSEEMLINDDNFYTITSDKEAIVRPKVCTWVERLHYHERSSQVIHDLLHLIMGHMVVVEPVARMKSKDLQEQLNKLLWRATNDRDYALKPVAC
ncbi:hypothetical protein ASPWEDRAFT_170557 [Aspergillus wentii DTO 134E9]|uniref:Protein kinase domain-containing protein n=1 Tax=Aspergillus wentii DTO 134E9 TaxID=1073089 RepID=A0A1L9RQB7_ASPWE|nr:uncharacterized protein ASPWEDRAFT_170557 [Aspergillus wentii DTO 134E9]OJJ37063.1 hypothetical protein ASPWEDRAFT_170557 [Aspergillus wentii DTO 134E9]